MRQSSQIELEDRGGRDTLTAVIRAGARKLIVQALETEVAELLATSADQQDAPGWAVVVRNGHHPARAIQTGIRPVTVPVPKVRSRRGEPGTSCSALVPPYVRKTVSLETAVPWLFLKGISTGEMQLALEA